MGLQLWGLIKSRYWGSTDSGRSPHRVPMIKHRGGTYEKGGGDKDTRSREAWLWAQMT